MEVCNFIVTIGIAIPSPVDINESILINSAEDESMSAGEGICSYCKERTTFCQLLVNNGTIFLRCIIIPLNDTDMIGCIAEIRNQSSCGVVLTGTTTANIIVHVCAKTGFLHQSGYGFPDFIRNRYCGIVIIHLVPFVNTIDSA